MKINKVILLTACINPNGMSFTKLQDKEERKKQYLEALDFYLSSTKLRIVFCDNSGEDLSGLRCQVNNPRAEMLSFQGNDYDKNLGKGYGEFGILQYAFQHSAFIKEATTVIKITGRLVVNNIVETIKLHEKLFGHPKRFVYVGELDGVSTFDSRCIVADKDFYLSHFLTMNNTVNDSAGYYFEHLLYDAISSLPENYIVSNFALPLRFSGISGSTGNLYENEELTNVQKLVLIRDFCQYKKQSYKSNKKCLYYWLFLVSFTVRIQKAIAKRILKI